MAKNQNLPQLHLLALKWKELRVLQEIRQNTSTKSNTHVDWRLLRERKNREGDTASKFEADVR